MASIIGGLTMYRDGPNINMVAKCGKTLEFSYVWGGDSPIDVTGFGAVLQVRDTDDTLVLEASVANGRITLGGTDGVISFEVSATDSAALTLGDHIYALELTTTGGKVYEPLTGSFTVKGEVVK